MRRILNTLLCLLIGGLATTAHAQSSDAIRAKVKEGDKVSITNEQGRSFSGRISSISADAITLVKGNKHTELPLAQVLKIERPKDSVLNGALWGLGVGAGMGFWQASTADEDYYQGDQPFCGVGFFDNCTDPEPPRVGIVITWSAIGALVGAGIDGLIHKGDRSIYRRGGERTLSIAPVTGRGRRGAAVSLAW